MNIIFLASSCTDTACSRYKGISQATSNWVEGLASGLQECNANVQLFAHVHDSLWPKGKVRPGLVSDLTKGLDQSLIHYWNIPFFRNLSISSSLVSNIKKHYKSSKTNPDVIITYNLYPYYNSTAKKISKKFGAPWIPIILDQNDPEHDNWNSFKTDSGSAKAAVFLSHWGYENAPLSHKLHLDAGGSVQQNVKIKSSDNVKKIVYAGKIADYGGIELLVETIKRVSDPHTRFIICGKGYSQALEDISKTDDRVIIKGFISDAQLNEICLEADMFINPRPSDFQENKMVFPSKILFYLGFGKPVLSTLTPGLSDDYKDVLFIPQSESPEHLALAIQEVLNLDKNELLHYRKTVQDFVINRSWTKQAQRLIDFIIHTKKYEKV